MYHLEIISACVVASTVIYFAIEKRRKKEVAVIGLLMAVLAIAIFPSQLRSGIHQQAMHLKREAFDRVPCPTQTDRTMVAFAFGQSNAGNSGESKHRSKPNVVNFFEGHCYVAQDPLLGAQGRGGSVWTLVADSLSGQYDYVVIAAAARNGASIVQWTEEFAPVFDERLKSLKENGYHVTHFLWHQGEADNRRLTAAKYATEIKTIIGAAQRAEPKAGFWVSLASRCMDALPDPKIRAGQLSVVDGKNVFLGPDTDILGTEYRRDDCHFSESGQERAAQMWVRAITAK